MDANEFRKRGYQMIDIAAKYMETVHEREVLPKCQPGYLHKLLPAQAPEEAQSWEEIIRDIEPCVMNGMTHWQHRHFHAYFPSGNSHASILGDIFSNACGIVGSSWESCPVSTELEMIICDWAVKFLGLPNFFLSKLSNPQSIGGGSIQTSASEAILLSMIAAREDAVRRLRKTYPNKARAVLLAMMTGYCSDQCHSCVEKNAIVSNVKLRMLECDYRGKVSGLTLMAAIREDKKNGFYPFFYCSILGSTGICAFDDLEEIGPICKENGLWLHVDGAYAGSSFVCPEQRYLSIGMEFADSFNCNTNKWMLCCFDASFHWLRDSRKLTDPLSGYDPIFRKKPLVTDFRNWSIPATKRFRAIKLWMMIRNYGVSGLRKYIRRHIDLAKCFEKYVRRDPRFEVIGPVQVGLCCFALIGPEDLNRRFLEALNASRRIHMVPTYFKAQYIIRWAVCAEHANMEDVRFAWHICAEYATVVIRLYEMENDSVAMKEILHQQQRVDQIQDSEQIKQSMLDVQSLEQSRIDEPSEAIINELSRAEERKPNFFPKEVADDDKGINAIGSKTQNN